MRLHRFIALGLALALITITFAGSFVPVAAQSISASIQPLNGLVQRMARGTSTWENVTQVTQIRVGDAIRTGSSGLANIVTTLGVQVTVYSNTELDLQELTLGSGIEGKLRASFGLLIGFVYVDISRKLSAGEVVLVGTPSGAAVATGTQMYAAVTKDNDVLIIGQESTPDYYQSDGTKVSVTPNSMAFSKAGATPVALTGLDDTASVTAFKGVLKALASQFYGVTATFFETALNVKPLPVDADLFKAIEAFTPPASTTFTALLEQLRTDLRKYTATLEGTARGDVVKFSAMPLATGVIAPATCGNKRIDTGETATNCPDDFYVFVVTDPPSCKPLTGASLANTPPSYCLYGVSFLTRRSTVASIIQLIINLLIRLGIIIPRPTLPPVRRTATFTPVPSNTPAPSVPTNTPVPTNTSTPTLTPTLTPTPTSTIRPSGLG